LAKEMRDAQRQREAVIAIEQEGGAVQYEHWFGEPRDVVRSQIVNGIPIAGSVTISRQPPEPNWPRKLLGDDFFKTVIIAQVRTDAALEQLGGLSQLRVVARAAELKSDRITGAGLESLANLSELEKLDLSDTNITDAGLKHLSRLIHLSDLNLRDTRISDAGLDHLTGLKNLHYLSIGLTRVTHDGADRLRQALPECKVYW